MSEPLRVALVVEGPTDTIMLKQVIRRFLNGSDFITDVLQPEMSEAFRVTPGEDGGWAGVCRWCIQTAEQGEGGINGNPLFASHDLLILQLDADVASCAYSDGHIREPFPSGALPCEEPCPPPSATTDRLREVMLSWIGESTVPPQTVMCIPSKALETWILVGLFPNDAVAKREYVECHENPAHVLQSKPLRYRLVRSGQKKIEKYEEFAPAFAKNWADVKNKCAEALRFEEEFLQAIGR